MSLQDFTKKSCVDLTRVHTKCGKIFREKLLENPNGRSLACDIWDVMTGEGNNAKDNCIGENFNQLIQTVISGWFEDYKPNSDTRVVFYVYTYLFWLYLFIERIEVILNEVDPNRNYGPINKFYNGLKTMNEIRLWANFMKHPKNFIFVHWPQFTFVGKSLRKNSNNTQIINTSYLKEHYSNESQKKPATLNNCDDVIVQFPKLDVLTEQFCLELLEFIRFICDNKLIRDELKGKSNK